MATITVKAVMNMAGFPEGEVRTVEKTETVERLMEAGYIVEAEGEERQEADGTTRDPVDVLEGSDGAAGGSGAAGGGKASSGRSEGAKGS